MKNLTLQLRLASLLSLILLACTAAFGQITPLGDTYTNSADPTTNYGAQKTLNVDAAKEITYIQFNLSSVPTGASLSQATLKLYVNTVSTAGAFEVYAVNGSWTESALTYSLAPALGSVIDSSVPITTADKNQYILIPMTSTVQEWLNTPSSNNGIALVAVGSFNATFDSKETTTTSHPPELDVVFAGDGTITGVTTASGSGLTGGGTSGTLNLALTNACAANQVLQWTGTSWICAAVGTGTVTSVGSGAGLTGGPITGSGTLSIATGGVTNAMLATSYAQLGAANTFTGNQTVNGNLSATGVVTGSSYQIGSNLFGFGNYANGNAFLGFAGNTTMTGFYNTASGFQALVANTTGYSNTASGYGTLNSNTTGYQNTAVGSVALLSNSTGIFNTALGTSALAFDTTGSYNTGTGDAALQNTSTGAYNTALGYASGYAADGSYITGSNDTFLGFFTQLTTGTFSNATAVGAYAEVSESNALVLGSFAGSPTCIVNGCSNTNVGIGTTSPGAPLEVDGSNQLDVFIKAPETGVGAGLDFFTTGSRGLQWEILDTGAASSQGANKLNIRNATSGIDVLTIVASGDVGIQTTTPSNSFTIGQGKGAALADGWSTYSSRRWKTNIHTLQGALSKVQQLRGVSYDLKGSGKHEVGVIAEEVGKVVPELVTYENNGKDARGVDYSRLTALLIEATKEQQALIHKQQEQIRVQQAQMKAQQARIDEQQAEIKAQQAQNGLQHAEIARVSAQVKAIQAALNTNGRTGSEVRTVRAQVSVVRQ
ncbi:MAG: DNRLRE domain-containing protein [Terriglobales bacterium]